MNYAYDKKNNRKHCKLKVPKHKLDAGADICWGHDFDIHVGQTVKLDTGISLDIPSGWFAMIVPRSSNTSITLANEEGIIDSSYTGNIILKLRNKTREVYNAFEEESAFQIIIVPHMLWNANLVDKINKETTRGDGAFGSTNEE